ncbi:MAG: IPExxxVDY family protein [Flavobacteriaceae bacterium]|nr:IPExxxVDY family protein [Flavobacteriaceae bacterium]
MPNYKLILDDDFGEDYSLIAIHCSEEAYKMAYLINRTLSLRLHRKRLDLDYSVNGLTITFPLFEFENELYYTSYHLVGNICRSQSAALQSNPGLFEQLTQTRTVTTYLIPEYSNVDFFLKISSDFEAIPLRNLTLSLNEIPQIISAYTIDTSSLKSKHNLIFD